jgi:vacuolar-type H+-ATPase subunit H
MDFLELMTPWNRGDSRVTFPGPGTDRADDGARTEGFMEEPEGEVTRAGLDDSLGSEVGERVEKLVDDAERDAQAIKRSADEEARAVLDAARAEASAIRDAAELRAQQLAAERVTRILALHRDLSEEADSLAALADDPEGVKARVDALLEALAHRADLLSRGIGPEPVAAAAVEAEEPAAPEAIEPERLEAAMAVPAAATPEPLREAHLNALRSAVAGASRAELEAELSATLAPEDAAAVLDDVFGRPRSPFPKWSAAAKKARLRA